MVALTKKLNLMALTLARWKRSEKTVKRLASLEGLAQNLGNYTKVTDKWLNKIKLHKLPKNQKFGLMPKSDFVFRL